eukprot:TRINITY_DN3125_c0_g1_i1.p1 TRINITY_DN3125_c0_g1~~TRINITY_DN3125_c0_g1_i1.p1  ORF type:complete len:377 (+),score=51.72 TRINITY_DN3125_c0_g1_i1:57-1187(+)
MANPVTGLPASAFLLSANKVDKPDEKCLCTLCICHPPTHACKPVYAPPPRYTELESQYAREFRAHPIEKREPLQQVKQVPCQTPKKFEGTSTSRDSYKTPTVDKETLKAEQKKNEQSLLSYLERKPTRPFTGNTVYAEEYVPKPLETYKKASPRARGTPSRGTTEYKLETPSYRSTFRPFTEEERRNAVPRVQQCSPRTMAPSRPFTASSSNRSDYGDYSDIIKQRLHERESDLSKSATRNIKRPNHKFDAQSTSRSDYTPKKLSKDEEQPLSCTVPRQRPHIPFTATTVAHDEYTPKSIVREPLTSPTTKTPRHAQKDSRDFVSETRKQYQPHEPPIICPATLVPRHPAIPTPAEKHTVYHLDASKKWVPAIRPC